MTGHMNHRRIPKRPSFLITLFFILFTFFPAASVFGTTQPHKKLTIGIIIDGPWERNEEVLKLFEKEITDLLENEYEVLFPTSKKIVGNWTVASIRKGVDKLLQDGEVNLILALGITASDEVCQRETLEKPVIAPFVVDDKLQGLPRKGKGSGKKNLNYQVSLLKINQGLNVFRDIVAFDSVVFVVAEYIKNDFDHVAHRIHLMTADMGVKSEILWISEPIEKSIALLKPEMQALFITPTLSVSRASMARFVAAANKMQIPSFSHAGELSVEEGIMASLQRETNFLRLARRVALNVQRILMGEDAGDLPVEFRSDIQLTINMKTARQVGVYPTWDVILEAELINEEESIAREPLNLMAAVNRGISANLQLLSKQTELLAGRQDVRAAAAKRLPQIDLSVTGVKIDKDRAASSMGMAAENTYWGSATLTQLIYSEQAAANVSIQNHLHNSRKAELDQVTLDIALASAVGYVNVLRAKALEGVRKNNLKRTRSHLELARVRQSLGVSSSSEVYRWEAQYATSQKDLMDAQNQRELAEINLARILHVPQSKRYAITDQGLDSPFLSGGNKKFFSYIDNPWVYRHFVDFIVESGLKNAPELAQMDAAVAAQKRLLKSTRHRFYLPTIALQAGVKNYFDKTGAGSTGTDMSTMYPAFNMNQLQALGSLFGNRPDKVEWNVGLNLSFSLFAGTEKFVENKKAGLQLRKLETDRQIVAEMVEQKIRNAVQQLGNANSKVPLSRKAADMAGKTLELVTDAYSRGAVSILELIDAQEAALAAELSAANAVYDFLAALFNSQRTVNRLDFLTRTDAEMMPIKEFEAYLLKKGIKFNPRGRQ